MHGHGKDWGLEAAVRITFNSPHSPLTVLPALSSIIICCWG
jgi:hypothetical protein